MKTKQKDQAVAYVDKKVPGPKESAVQVRNSGAESTRDSKQADWDAVDEASDESFPASDATAKY